MTIHPAVHAFGPSAGAYERGRPDYPQAAIEHIVQTFGITPASTVVDLAAGTGKLTRLLGTTGASVIAIEPIAGMREELIRQVPGVEVCDGTAQDIPLEDASVDVVTVAQAFHWFATEEALREIHRVLKPGGGLALIWNQRDMAQPLQRELTELIEQHRTSEPTHRSGEWSGVFEETALFGTPVEWQVRHKQPVDQQTLVDRVLSISFIAALPETERDRVREGVIRLVTELETGGTLRYITSVFTSTRL